MGETIGAECPPVAFFLARHQFVARDFGKCATIRHDGIVVIAGPKTCHKTSRVGLYRYRFSAYYLLGCEIEGINAQAVGAMANFHNLKRVAAREEELVIINGQDASWALGISHCFVAPGCFYLLICVTIVEIVIQAHHFVSAHFGNRSDTDIVVASFFYIKSLVVEHDVAKRGGDINLAVGECDIIDNFGPVQYHFLDGWNIDYLAIIIDDVDVAVVIGNYKILLVVVVINLTDFSAVEHIVGIKHLIGSSFLVVAVKASARKIINTIACINAVSRT